MQKKCRRKSHAWAPLTYVEWVTVLKELKSQNVEKTFFKTG
jgi:hypothetical protein